MESCDFGSSIGSRLRAKTFEYIARTETGRAIKKRPPMPRKLRRPTENVVTVTRGGDRPCARNASMTADPPDASDGGAIHGAPSKSARAILRRRASGLDKPVA